MAANRENPEMPSISRRDVLRYTSAFIAAAAGAPLLAACGNKSHAASPSTASAASAAAAPSGAKGAGKKGSIGFSFPDSRIAVFRPLAAGAKQEASQRGYDLIISAPNADASAQISAIQSWIAAKQVSAMTFLPIDANSAAPLAKQAKAKGIKVVGYAYQLPDEDGFVTFDNTQGGNDIGAFVAQWVQTKLGGKAKVAVLELPSLAVSKQRLDPALQTLSQKASGAQIVARQKAPDAATALNVTQSILQAHPDVNVLVGFNDDVLLGARQAFIHAGHDASSNVCLVGFDGGKEVLSHILAGDVIRATGALDLLAIGKAIVDVPANILEGKQPTTYDAKYLVASHEKQSMVQRLINNYSA